MNEEIALELLLDYTQPYEALIEEVKKRIAAGAERETLLDQLKALRPIAVNRGGEKLEDEVLYVMDRLVGWCAPDAKL